MMKQTNPVFESIDKDKLRRMLAIREEYNAGKLTLEEARRRMRDEVGKVSPEEFAAAEQLVKDEDPDECRNEDVHEIIHIFDGLIDEPRPELPFGHPIDAYRREVDEMKELLRKGVIGREVRNCHPPKSVHLVEEIIEKFRNGEQSRAEFWINKPDLFIYIVYVAVRDADGRFRGVMEMMQDCTHIRKLEGSRTLLTWDEEQQHNSESSSETTGIVADNEELTPNTKLKVLLKRYPRLIDDLPTINPKFAMLKTPIAKVMIPVATVKMMSERSDMPLEELIDKLKKLIATY